MGSIFTGLWLVKIHLPTHTISQYISQSLIEIYIHVHVCMYISVPWTRISAGSLLAKGRVAEVGRIAKHVTLVALLSDDPVTLIVVIRRFSDSFIGTGSAGTIKSWLMRSPTGCPSTSQLMNDAVAVQFNTSTSLSEIFMDGGGITIPEGGKDYTVNQPKRRVFEVITCSPQIIIFGYQNPTYMYMYRICSIRCCSRLVATPEL